MICLNAHSWDIEIDTENGSLFRRCRYQGHQVFRDFQESENSEGFPQYSASHFPLLPFSNRIENGTFSIEDKTVKLPVNAPGQTHTLHGYGWLLPWMIKSQKPNLIELVQHYTPGDWPWPYQAVQSVEVKENALRMSLSLTNLGISPMPAGLGFHPYFPDLKNAYLSFKSGAVWIADDEVLPTRKVLPSVAFDLNAAKPLRTFDLDHCYEQVGTAQITWANSPLNLTIKSSDNLDKAAVYTAHAENCFCFEPVSHTHNAVNFDSPEAEGMVFLQPAETLSAWCEIAVDLP